MKNLLIFGSLVLTLTLGGCATSGGGSTADSDAAAAESAIAAASASLKKARSVESEWRDSKKKMLKKAKAAASKGEFKKAIKLANKAKFQGEMGYQQGMEQKDAGPWLF